MSGKRSIKIRITLWYSAFMLFIVAALTAAVFLVMNRSSESAIQKSLEQAIGAVAAEIRDERGTDLKQLLDDEIDGRIQVAIYGSDEELLSGIEPERDERSSYDFEDGAFQTRLYDSQLYYIYDRLIAMSEDSLWVRGYVRVMGQTDYLQLVEHVLLFALPVILLVMIAGGYLLTRRALEPLKIMEQEVEEITSGDDLERRLETEGQYEEIQALSCTVNDMLVRLQKSFETEKQFISDASHELRTPVSVILMQCESLDETSGLEDYQTGIRRIERQTARMQTLIEELLDLSRLTLKRVKFEPVHMNLAELLQELLFEQRMLHPAAVFELEAPETVQVYADRVLTERALINLLGNAVKYGGTRIIVQTVRHAQYIEIRVCDNGIGIEETKLSSIWDRFYQVDESRSRKGFGLGLSIVKEIALMQGGYTSVTSTPGEGSSFSVFLPE